MKVTPLKRYTAPRFPTREAANANPALLRLLPKRWQRNATVVAAVGATAALVYAVMHRPEPTPGVQVAPLFLHGDGIYHGWWGCISVKPPVFLSEDEACTVIQEEAHRVGLSLTDAAIPLPNTKVPFVNPYHLPSRGQRQSLLTDGHNATQNISYIFVSAEDINHWEAKPLISPRTVNGSAGRYDTATLHAAQQIDESLHYAKRPGTYAIFYDPLEEVTKGDFVCIQRNSMELAPPEFFQKLDVTTNIDRYTEYELSLDKHKITFHENSDFYEFDGDTYLLPGILDNGMRQYFVPLYQTCRALGLPLRKDPETHMITVTNPHTGVRCTISPGGPRESKDALRQQVRDFITWLKAQGII
jgi:hypothetical protein